MFLLNHGFLHVNFPHKNNCFKTLLSLENWLPSGGALYIQNKPNLAEDKTTKSYHLHPPSNKDKGGLESQSKA